MTPLLNLPDRPLALAPNVISTPRLYIWSIPFPLLLMVFIFLWEAPGIYRDLQISQNPLALEDGDVQDGRCTTHKFIFTECNARLVYSYNGQNYDSKVEVMFVDLRLGDYETGVVISADHPELATMSLALDKLWNRITTLAVTMLLLGIGVAGMAFLTVRNARARSRLRRPALLTPIPVHITALKRARGILSVTYTDKIPPAKKGVLSFTRMTNGEEPLLVGSAGGKPVGLAVRHGDTVLPVLLDRGLQRILLTDDERRAALASLGGLADTHQQLALVETPVRTMSVWKRLQLFFGVLLLAFVGLFGFWLWYVTSSETQFQSPGMDINNLMPAPLNEWGCAQLKKRFGQERAPHGCTAADFTSWK